MFYLLYTSRMQALIWMCWWVKTDVLGFGSRGSEATDDELSSHLYVGHLVCSYIGLLVWLISNRIGRLCDSITRRRKSYRAISKSPRTFIEQRHVERGSISNGSSDFGV